jgi:hypothetical protein
MPRTAAGEPDRGAMAKLSAEGGPRPLGGGDGGPSSSREPRRSMG